IASLGDSAVIVGDDRMVKVHIHTEAPGTVLNYVTALGSLRQISIANMQEQHEDFLEMHAHGPGHGASAVHEAAAGMRVSGRDVRDARVDGLEMKSGDIIGLLNNKLVTTGDDRDQVAWDLLERMGAAERELITVYWGGDITQAGAEAFRGQLVDRYTNAEVEL